MRSIHALAVLAAWLVPAPLCGQARLDPTESPFVAALESPDTTSALPERIVPADYDAVKNKSAFTPTAGFQMAPSHDVATKTQLTGDWKGARTRLAAQGILYNAELTQFYQGVTSGGSRQNFEYGGKLDQFLIVNGAQLGLWEGFMTIMHAETRFGDDVIGSAAGLSPTNVSMLYPAREQTTAVTGLFFQQALTESLAVAAGKFQALDLVDMLYHTGRGIDGFMNTSFVMIPTLSRTTNLSFLGAGLLKLRGPEVEGAVLVYDTNNSTTTSGFDQLFNSGAAVLGVWKFSTDFGGLPGYQSVGGNWSSRDYTTVDPEGFIIIPEVGVIAEQVADTWSLFYVFDQKLWVDPCREQRNLGVYSQFGLADGDPNPIRWTASVALTANGMVPGREADSIGLGYFFEGLSSKFKDLVGAELPIQDLHGVELYYKAVLAPWFHVSADLQVVDPAVIADGTAVIFGLRAAIDL